MTLTMTAEQVGEREHVMKRFFKAPRELVWKAWTEPERIARWWGPKGFDTDVKTMDVRPGGVWHYCMRSAQWGDAWGKATYREVVPPERLVYVDNFSDEAGDAVEGMPEIVLTVTFTERDGGTLLTLHSLFASAEERAKVLEMGMELGMGESLDRLADLVSAEEPS